MMEQATEREAVWCTVQFASGAGYGDHLELDTEIVAHGHRTSQVRVMARVDGREVFTAVGATGAAGGRTSTTFAPMPSVGPPEESNRNSWPAPSDREKTHFGTTEIREAVVHGGTEGARRPASPSGRGSTGPRAGARRCSGTSPTSSRWRSTALSAPGSRAA